MSAKHLICTVGNSLKGNIEKLEDGVHPNLKAAWQAGQWGQVAARLSEIGPTEHVCGAEINSLHELLAAGSLVDADAALTLCVSDTDDGRAIGQVLKSFYEGKGHRVDLSVIEFLQDRKPQDFRVFGLRNLAREIGRVVRNAGDPRYVAIDATGGYKAQIAIAVLIGQALEVPVFYKHEQFATIISLPPMPVSFDYDLFAEYADLLDEFESKGVMELDASAVDERLRTLLEEVEVDGKTAWALAPVGQIYLDGYRHRHPVAEELPPPAAMRTEPTFRDDHYPDGFRDFVNKVWRETPYIKGCHSLPYDGQRGIRDRRFYVRAEDGQIVGEYRAQDFGARFGINTTATTQAQKTAVVQDLNTRYGR